MPNVYIGFGSNVGDRQQAILSALQQLNATPDLKWQSVSSLYETEPVGYTNQADFLNGVVCFYTDLTAASLLSHCQSVEAALGRTREIRWGPRVIDLDILLYGSHVIRTEHLTVPHPELPKRRFVLAPFNEIASQVVVPGLEKPIKQLYEDCRDFNRVTRVVPSEQLANQLDEE